MNITAAQSLARSFETNPGIQAETRPNPEAAAKLKESCRQFEAVLWRSVLEKANSPQSGGTESAESGDKTGTYQYFINDTIANSVSGLPSSFSSILFAALAPHLPQESTPGNPS